MPLNELEEVFEEQTAAMQFPISHPEEKKRSEKAAFSFLGHNSDTLKKAVSRMQPPSKPLLSKSNDNMWYIYWNHDVPYQLWDKYNRKRIRVKKYDNINRYKGAEREKYAKLRLKVWEYVLRHRLYSPFDEELEKLIEIRVKKQMVTEEIVKVATKRKESKKSDTNIIKALDLYLKSRIERTDNTNSHSTHRGVVGWFTKYLTENNLLEISVSEITRQIVADALLFTKQDRKWGATTYNSHVDLIMTFMNWLEREEYILKNPATGKIEKLRAIVGKNTWYNREIANKVKAHMIKTGNEIAYNACAFTYHLLVRSQSELLKLKVADFDFELKRIRFRKEVSKNGMEAFRDFTPEFEKIALKMKLDQLPEDYYVFGKGGLPSKIKAGKNTLSLLYKPVKDKFKISEDYSIYGWKHTRVVHEMMRRTDAYEIQHICRHSSLDETQKYMRGFDLSLRNVYGPEDLTF